MGVTACNRVSYGAHASVHCPTYAISRAPPAHHFVRRSPGVKLVLQPTAGRRGRRPLRAVCILRGAACNLGAPPAHHLVRANRRCPFAHAGRGWGRRCEKSTSSKTGGFLCENGAPAQEGFTPSECSRRAGSPRRSWSCRRSGRRSGTRRSRRSWRWRRDCGSQESLSFSFKVHSNP